MAESVFGVGHQAEHSQKESAMAEAKRKAADCRLFPSEKNCSLYIAGTEEEVLKVAVKHAVDDHGHTNSPELKSQIRQMLRDEK